MESFLGVPVIAVAPRMIDRDSGELREPYQGPLVLGSEFATAMLFGEIKAPERLTSHQAQRRALAG
jgi:hypothetical protein